MRKTIRENKGFTLPYLVFLIVLFPVLMLVPKGDIHLSVNAVHSPLADQFFRWITYLGDGLMPVILAVILAVFNFRRAVILLTSGLVAGIVAQFFKRIIFSDVVRPTAFFEDPSLLHLVYGVELHQSFSFPSGHAATAFSLGFCLACFSKSPSVKFLFFCLALTVAFSRVYLSQHFLNDIYAGSIIGVLSSVLFLYLWNRSNAPWLDKSFIGLIKKPEV